jgi:heme A synthase
MQRRLSVKLSLRERVVSATCAASFFLFAFFLANGVKQVAPAYADALLHAPAQMWFSQTSVMIASLLLMMVIGKLAGGYVSTQMAVRAWTGWPKSVASR